MKRFNRLQFTSGAFLVSNVFFGASASIASAQNEWAQEVLLSTTNTTSPPFMGNLAVSSNMPVGSPNQWSNYFSLVPNNTGVFIIDQYAGGTFNENNAIDSWFDSNNAPFGVSAGQSGLTLVTQGEADAGTYDRLWTIDSSNKVYYNTPVGPSGSWGAWTYIGAPVPGGTNLGIQSLSILNIDDTPWAINNSVCNMPATYPNRQLYHWVGPYGSRGSWVQQPGCFNSIAEQDTCLLASAVATDNNVYIWTSPRSSINWTRGAKLSGTNELVFQMAVVGTSSSLRAYYSIGDGNLYEWSGACSTTGTVTTVLETDDPASPDGPLEVMGVARDWHTGQVYYQSYNFSAGKYELLAIALPI